MRMRRKPWVREELAEAEFFIDDATQNLGKWHKAFKRKNQPMHLELRMRKRKLYSKTCSIRFSKKKYRKRIFKGTKRNR